MTIQPLRPIRDLILPLLVNGTDMREMLATAIYHRNEATEGDTEASLSELRDMGHVIVHDEETGRWWLEQPEGAA